MNSLDNLIDNLAKPTNLQNAKLIVTPEAWWTGMFVFATVKLIILGVGFAALSERATLTSLEPEALIESLLVLWLSFVSKRGLQKSLYGSEPRALLTRMTGTAILIFFVVFAFLKLVAPSMGYVFSTSEIILFSAVWLLTAQFLINYAWFVHLLLNVSLALQKEKREALCES